MMTAAIKTAISILIHAWVDRICSSWCACCSPCWSSYSAMMLMHCPPATMPQLYKPWSGALGIAWSPDSGQQASAFDIFIEIQVI